MTEQAPESTPDSSPDQHEPVVPDDDGDSGGDDDLVEPGAPHDPEHPSG